MIPYYSRVAAIDDNSAHLDKIVRGLGRAGFSTLPIFFEGGIFDPVPTGSFPGMRLVFSDIHLGVGGYGVGAAARAATIINGLKGVVGKGPYGLIFWSQFPDEAQEVWTEIEARADESNLALPIGWDVIDKKEVFNVADDADDQFDPIALRDQILEKVGKFKTLKLAIEWDERVAQAAMLATSRLFELAAIDVPQNQRNEVWLQLLAYLCVEAVGETRTLESPIYALDNALLPLLEDQLYSVAENVGKAPKGDNPIYDVLNNLEKGKALKRPNSISTSALNSHYLIEIVDSGLSHMWERGMVTTLGGRFINSGQFFSFFGQEKNELIRAEFVMSSSKISDDEIRQLSLQVVELGTECDHVQGKIATHRYLLAVLLPSTLLDKFFSKNKKLYANESIRSIGELQFTGVATGSVLLVSCRRFMVLPPGTQVDGVCKFRLRRSVIDELAHYYATYARRPGVMRFYS